MDRLINLLKFNENGLIPAIVQDHKTKEVLTLCYMNREAIEKTIKERKVYVYRRSKGRLMMKGETSGCIQKVREVSIDCEGNSILFKVDQKMAGCHTGFFTCYFRKLDKAGNIKTIGKRVFNPEKIYRKN